MKILPSKFSRIIGASLSEPHLVTSTAALSIYLYISRGQPHPKYKANFVRTSHTAVWERHPQTLRVTGDEFHDGPERGPVDRDGARSTKSKHSISSIRGLRVSPGRFVGLFPFA